MMKFLFVAKLIEFLVFSKNHFFKIKNKEKKGEKNRMIMGKTKKTNIFSRK